MSTEIGVAMGTTTETESENPVYMSTEEIKNWQPYTEFPKPGDYKSLLKTRMQEVNQWSRKQVAGRRWGIGCVSLEITQRCNLDCTLCYLSDHSEAVKDVPLQEIFNRIDMIYRHYGPNTDIQVSGGDPTLRERSELVAIVKKINEYGMRSSLLTNGIKATRDLLTELASVGLKDVAFHVDLTQERKGYRTEMELNKIREDYIERARGLPIAIIFNLTVCADNFKEIPDLVRFYIQHAGTINFASFQLQADTGRGVLRERDFLITQDTVTAQINKGAGIDINFDVPMTGHPKCNKYSFLLEAGGNLYNFVDDFVLDFIEKTADSQFDRANKWKTIKTAVSASLKHSDLLAPGLKFIGRHFWNMKKDLVKSRGKVNKIGFFVHNFMDSCKLETERIQGCVFMVATKDGPLSMCMHNAKRDEYILAPVKVKSDFGTRVWNPLTGEILEETVAENLFKSASIIPAPTALPMKHTKGRVRKELMQNKLASTQAPAQAHSQPANPGEPAN